MTNLIEIGGQVKTQRKLLRMTQQQLADAACVSRLLIAKLETERLPELGVKKLMRILNAVGLDLRVSTLNRQRPTLEDLWAEEDAGS